MTADCDGDLITPEQGIAARDLLNQTPLEIARKLAMSRETIERAIGKRRQTTSMTPRVAKRLRSYFEGCGVEFLPDGQVRMKQATE
jgi:plasmid maintenance system antidote protein VapI